MSITAASTVKVTAIEPCGENKVCITVELVVDVHRLADVSSSMLPVAAKGIASKKIAITISRPVPDQVMGDGDGDGQLHRVFDLVCQPRPHFIFGQPARILDLMAVDAEVAAQRLRIAAQHQG